MRGDDRVIEFLNEHLTAELTLINQYFLDSRMLDNWGLPGLAKVFRDMAFDEMRDAEHLVDRILLLEGHPNLQRLGTVRVGEEPHEMLRIALDSEYGAIERLTRGAALCLEVDDHATHAIVTEMLAEEQEHADFLEGQIGVIERVGIQNYLAAHLHGS